MSDAPNVFLLSADSLRAAPFVGTARTVQDATGAVRFRNAVAPACHTASSVPALATGRFGDGTGPADRDSDSSSLASGPAPRDVASVLESFRAAGYETVLLTDNPLVAPSLDEAGSWTGGSGVDATLPRPVTRAVERWYFRAVWPWARRLGLAGPYYRPATSLHETARDRIADADRPVFCWVHYMDTHHPYWPPAPDDPEEASYRTAALSRRLAVDAAAPETIPPAVGTLYRRTCEALGTEIERFVRTLATEDLFDPATDVLAVTADHGECPDPERGLFGHVPPASWESLVHVPLVVARPDWPETTVDDQVSLIDLPRILRGAPGVPDPDLDGDGTASGAGDASLCPTDFARERVFTVARTLGASEYVRGVRRDDGRKLFGRRTNAGVDVVHATYEAGEPATERVLSVRDPDELDDGFGGDGLAAALARRGGPTGAAAGTPEYDESRLRALGYVE